MKINSTQEETLRALIDDGARRAAEMLETMIGSQVRVEVPILAALKDAESLAVGDETFAIIRIGLSGAYNGQSFLAMPESSASRFVTTVSGEDESNPGFEAHKAAALSEVGNIVINGVVGSIGNALQATFDFTPPDYSCASISDLKELASPQTDVHILFAQTEFRVADLDLEGSIILLFEQSALLDMLSALDRYVAENATTG